MPGALTGGLPSASSEIEEEEKETEGTDISISLKVRSTATAHLVPGYFKKRKSMDRLRATISLSVASPSLASHRHPALLPTFSVDLSMT
jgi:hypothetical protein